MTDEKNETKNEQIIRRIKKLLALGKSPSEAEAAAALAKAQELMARYGLTQSAIDLSAVSEAGSRLRSGDKPPVWEAALIGVICRAFGVEVFRQHDSRGASAVFVGVDAAPDVASYAFAVLYRAVLSGRKDHLAKLRVKRSTKTRRGDVYCLGYVRGVAEKIADFAGVKNDALIKAYLDDRYGPMVTGKLTNRVKKATARDSASYYAGLQAGADAQLRRGVGGTAAPALACATMEA